MVTAHTRTGKANDGDRYPTMTDAFLTNPWFVETITAAITGPVLSEGRISLLKRFKARRKGGRRQQFEEPIATEEDTESSQPQVRRRIYEWPSAAVLMVVLVIAIDFLIDGSRRVGAPRGSWAVVLAEVIILAYAIIGLGALRITDELRRNRQNDKQSASLELSATS